MSDQILPSRLLRGLLEHLDREALLLERLQRLASSLTQGGYAHTLVVARQPEVAQLAGDVAELQRCREEMRTALSRIWKCPPEHVRLSRIQLDEAGASQQLHERRRAVLLQAARTAASLQATQQSLASWHGLLSGLLSQALPCAESSERYTAAGQRIIPLHVIGMEIRS